MITGWGAGLVVVYLPVTAEEEAGLRRLPAGRPREGGPDVVQPSGDQPSAVRVSQRSPARRCRSCGVADWLAAPRDC